MSLSPHGSGAEIDTADDSVKDETMMRLLPRGRLGRAIMGAAMAGLVAALIYYVATRDPTPIAMDPRVYDDYAGYYDFGHSITAMIRRDGDRLLATQPEYLPRQLLPETEAKYFVKGEPGRTIFHRAPSGQVDYAVWERNGMQLKAERKSDAPPPAEYATAVIAATTGGKAMEAGLAILKEGGTAADAAMAIALCEVVHAGGSYVSFGGPMMVMYFEASSSKVHYLDAQFNTPVEERSPATIPATGGRTAMVPGFMAGLEAVHSRFGKLPLAKLFEAAIALAEKGETVNPAMAWWLKTRRSVLSRRPETKRVFTRPDGKFYGYGDTFRQPELANTLRKVAAHGARYMYDGAWGQKFVEVIQKDGGKMTMADMKRYQAVWEDPLRTAYREFQVYAPGMTAWGGVNIEALNLLELAKIKERGHFASSPESFLWLMQIAQVHRLTWNLPAPTRHDLSPKSRATKATAAWIWQEMQSGDWEWLPKKMRQGAAANHTDALGVVDSAGNMAVVNHTINSMLWGDTGIFVDGVSIPDPGAHQAREIERAGPGNRLPIGMSPLIVLREGKVVLGSSSTGAGLHSRQLEVLLNILDFGMEPQEAVDRPGFFAENGEVEANTFEPALLDGVRKLGMEIKVQPSGKAQRGYWVGVKIDPARRTMRGGVSRGLEGEVAGY